MFTIYNARRKQYLLLVLAFCSLGEINTLSAQTSPQQAKTAVAGKQYHTSNFHQSLWGKHYRKEWNTPVNFKVAMLDTLAGGLTAYETGGGRQSKSLQLRDANGREYVLRSIDKTFGKALPEIVQKTFIENIADDQVSIAHPYSAVTIPAMAESAKILHTNPQIFYIPKQAALGRFSEEYGDKLYLFEQRADENWETAANFANAEKIIGTERLLEKLQEDNDQHVDQVLYVRSRIFDFFIGDWGRHEDQWRWARYKSGGETYYKPIPRDRDQSYTKFDGFLLGLVKPGRMQTFSYDIKNIRTFNFPARNLDRRMANEVTLGQWIEQAKELQILMTDEVIENSVRRMPPEVFPISGNEIISKLKARRAHLEEYARDYYLFLAKEVDIPGSKDNELFEVKRLNDGSTAVNIFKITNEGKTKDKPFYSRVFYKNETREIRLYGLGAEDKYEILGKADQGIKVKLIGGPDKDEYNDASSVRGLSHKTKIYDNPGNTITTSGETRSILSKDPSINGWLYDAFTYSKAGIKPIILYSNEDHIYVGLKYARTTYGWRKNPFATKQELDVKYSLTEKAFSSTYEGDFTGVIRKWDLNLYANYDQVRWYNYFGLGNESKRTGKDRTPYRLRTQEIMGKAGFSRRLGKYHKIGLYGFYQVVRVKNDSTFTKSLLPPDDELYNNHQFAGAQFVYSLQAVNDSLLPTKGFSFSAAATYTDNLKNNNNFMRYSGIVQLFLPFSKKIGIAIKTGASTLTGTPEFYQYNYIGGGSSLRGYNRTRFFGKTAVFDQNELRWVKDIKSYLYRGKFGLLAFYDVGRVWMPGEKSTTWHSGYGGGIILAPYNKITASAGYGVSKEGGVLFLRLLRVI